MENDTKKTTFADVRNAKILDLAIHGVSKRTIAKEFAISESSVERIVYSEEGQKLMVKAVEAMNLQLTERLPLLMDKATDELYGLFLYSSKTPATVKLKAIELVLGLWLKANRAVQTDVEVDGGNVHI